MTYKSLFGDETTPAKSNLFGEVKDNSGIRDIEDWLKANPTLKSAPGRIEFNLNRMKVEKITMQEVGIIGDHTIAEATKASECLEEVVTEFAKLKPYLEEPKKLLLEALELIEGDSRPKGLKGLFQWKTTPKLTPVELRTEVKELADKALVLMENCVKYRLDPFIEGLNDALYHCKNILKAMDDSINTLIYVNQRSTDANVKDLALRRSEMCNKSVMLMQMNKGQLEQMAAFCEKNKSFHKELDSVIIPFLDNIMRSAVIGDVSGDSLIDVAAKLKGLVL